MFIHPDGVKTDISNLLSIILHRLKVTDSPVVMAGNVFIFHFSIFILTTKYAKLFQSIQDFLQELCVILKLRDFG